jgi:hypothetical protein
MEVDVTSVDLGPLLEVVISLLGVVLSAVGYKAVRWLQQKTGTEALVQDEIVRQYVEKAAAAAVEYGKQRVGGGVVTVNVRNQIIATGAGYMIKRVPDALARFGLDEEGVREMLEARLRSDPEPEQTGNEVKHVAVGGAG